MTFTSIMTIGVLLILFIMVAGEEICEFYKNGNLSTVFNCGSRMEDKYRPKLGKNNIRTIRELVDVFPGIVKWRLAFVSSVLASLVLTIVCARLDEPLFLVASFCLFFLVSYVYSSWSTYHLYGPVSNLIKANITFMEDHELQKTEREATDDDTYSCVNTV